MTYSIFTQGGTGNAVTEFEFYTRAIKCNDCYSYITEDCKALFPYCKEFTNFRIVIEDGKERCFSREVFFSLIKAQNHHRSECKEEGIPFSPQFYVCVQRDEERKPIYWTLLPPTAENKTIANTIRNIDRIEANDKSFENRCWDYINNKVCRHVRDKNGKLVKDGNGKAIPTKCGECPRTGESHGDRINCCLRHVCVAECWRCPIPKQCNAPQILGGYDVPNIPDFRSEVEEQQFLNEHKGLLTEDELAFYQAVYVNDQKPTDYIRELVNKNPDKSFSTIERQQFRIRNRIKQKAINLKKEKY